MKVLFIYTTPRESEKVYTGFHQGLGSLSAVLKKSGHQTSLCAASSLVAAELEQHIQQVKPDLIGISVTTNQFPLAQEIIRFVRQKFSFPLVAGGIHATVAPETLVTIEGVLGVCVGEGERALLRLIDCMENNLPYSHTPNFWFREKGAIIKNDPAPLDDVDMLPIPDRSLFDMQRIIDRYEKIIGAEFAGSRGCPYHCAYCANQYLNSLYHNTYYRPRKVDALIAEIKEARQKYRFSMIGFHDDTFTFDQAWLTEFCETYAREINLPFWCNTRVDCLNEHKIKLLKKANCFRLHVGLESGSERLRSQVLKRPFTNQEIIDTFFLIRKYRIKVIAFNMIGLPYETEEDIIKTIELNRTIRPDRIHLTVFYPYPGTELSEVCRKEGWGMGTLRDNFYDPISCLRQPTLSQATIEKYYREFELQVYK